MPAPCIQTKIGACVCESPSSAAWGTFLWPAIHIGSCITSPKEQNELVSAILSMENKTRCCTRLVEFLSSLWVALRDDGTYYGPYGIRPLMDRVGIRLSLGWLRRIYFNILSLLYHRGVYKLDMPCKDFKCIEVTKMSQRAELTRIPREPMLLCWRRYGSGSDNIVYPL